MSCFLHDLDEITKSKLVSCVNPKFDTALGSFKLYSYEDISHISEVWGGGWGKRTKAESQCNAR